MAAVYRLRARPGYVPKFRTPGYPFVPAIFLLSVVYLLGNSLVANRNWTAGIFAVILLGIPVYRIFVVGRESRT